MNAKPGFTLIELVVTIAIAGILLALAVPSFREITLNNQRASKTNELITALNYARGQALALRREVVVCRTSSNGASPPVCGQGLGWEDGWVVFQDVDGNGAPTNDAEVLRRQGSLISASDAARRADQRLAVRGGPSRVTFRPNGSVAAGGTLTICDARGPSKGIEIVVSLMGQTRANDKEVTSRQQ